MAAIDAAMPGSWPRVAPFLQRLPALRAGQKAAAVNLGIFPDAGDTDARIRSGGRHVGAGRTAASTDAIASPASTSILRAADSSAPPAQLGNARPRPLMPRLLVACAGAAAPPSRGVAQPGKIWLQLASGPNADGASRASSSASSRSNRDLFDGISGYVARSPTGPGC